MKSLLQTRQLACLSGHCKHDVSIRNDQTGTSSDVPIHNDQTCIPSDVLIHNDTYIRKIK